jgi:hypothetical protein
VLQWNRNYTLCFQRQFVACLWAGGISRVVNAMLCCKERGLTDPMTVEMRRGPRSNTLHLWWTKRRELLSLAIAILEDDILVVGGNGPDKVDTGLVVGR